MILKLTLDFQGNDAVATPIGSTFRDDMDLDLDLDSHERPSPTWGRLPDPDYVDEASHNRNATANRKLKAHKTLYLDALTQIGRDELIRWDREYLQNMSRLEIQKAYARSVAQARKNATCWVSDRGIGSVGMGIGLGGAPHPLKSFCGEALLVALSIEQPIAHKGRKRSSDHLEHEEEPDDRNVRPRITDGEVGTGLTRRLDGQQVREVATDPFG